MHFWCQTWPSKLHGLTCCHLFVTKSWTTLGDHFLSHMQKKFSHFLCFLADPEKMMEKYF